MYPKLCLVPFLQYQPRKDIPKIIEGVGMDTLTAAIFQKSSLGKYHIGGGGGAQVRSSVADVYSLAAFRVKSCHQGALAGAAYAALRVVEGRIW